ncbi:MAG: amidohydrolase [Bacteroidota bacterium]
MPKILLYKKLNIIIISCLLFVSSCFKVQEADLIVHNATIHTVDSAFSKAQAMAVKNGKIVWVGTENEIFNKYRAKEVIDAGTRHVYPGFIDAHCHFYEYGLGLQQVDLVGTRSFDEIIERLIKYHKKFPQTIAKSPKQQITKWIIGRGWDQNDWEIKEFPNKSTLDSLFPHTPVLLKRIDGHAVLANMKAMNRAGITINTKIEGGSIEIKNNNLTGLLTDNAIDLITELIPPPLKEQITKALLDAQNDCFAFGLTTVDNAGLDKKIVDIIDSLHKETVLKMRIYAMLSPTKENYEHFSKTGPYKTERLNVRSFKFYTDGSLGSRGGCLLEPYSDIIEQLYYGMLLKDTAYFEENARKLFDMGFQMNTHCIGDSTNRVILNIYGKVLKNNNDKRWRIEHAQVVHPADLKKFTQFNIIPSVQPTHATSDMYWAEDRLGSERIKTAYAYKKLLGQNGMIALGTDFPVEDINPLNTFYAAVARKDLKGYPEDGFQIENALTRVDALRGMTIWAATANFEENEKGSLEVGKFADFVILDNDIMTIPLDKIKNIKVVSTFINGEKVYEIKN